MKTLCSALLTKPSLIFLASFLKSHLNHCFINKGKKRHLGYTKAIIRNSMHQVNNIQLSLAIGGGMLSKFTDVQVSYIFVYNPCTSSHIVKIISNHL
jgi:hypothetical protein